MSKTRMFCVWVEHSAVEKSGQQFSPEEKVKWDDIPKEHTWLLRSWGQGGATLKSVVEKAVILDISAKNIKDTFAWYKAHALHTFTHYEASSNGYEPRFRVARKPLVDVVYSYSKKGIASQVQSNRFWLHRQMLDGGLDTLMKKVFAEIPKAKVAALENKEKSVVNVLTYEVEHMGDVEEGLDKMVNFTTESGSVMNDSLREELLKAVRNYFTPSKHMVGGLSTTLKRHLFGDPWSEDLDLLRTAPEIGQSVRDWFTEKGADADFVTDSKQEAEALINRMQILTLNITMQLKQIQAQRDAAVQMIESMFPSADKEEE